MLLLQLSCNLQNSHYWQLKTMFLFVCFYFFYSTQALLPHPGQLLHKCSFHCYRLQLAPWAAWAHSPGMLLHCQCFSWLSLASKIVGARPGVSPMQVLVTFPDRSSSKKVLATGWRCTTGHPRAFFECQNCQKGKTIESFIKSTARVFMY